MDARRRWLWEGGDMGLQHSSSPWYLLQFGSSKSPGVPCTEGLVASLETQVGEPVGAGAAWAEGFTPGGPPLGKVSISTMKVALTAAIFAALVTATAGGMGVPTGQGRQPVYILYCAQKSLSCVQCSSWSGSCANEKATQCASGADTSCVSSSANFSLGEQHSSGACSGLELKRKKDIPGHSSVCRERRLVTQGGRRLAPGEFLRLYQDMSCSGQNCTQELDPFTVHVASGKHVHFASQCCQGQPCGNDSDVLVPAPDDGSSNTMCPACYGLNTTSCSEKTHRCSWGQQCVQIEVDFTNGTSRIQHLLLKGCSDISNSTCQLLGTANQTVRGIIFRQVQCSQASLVPNTSGSFKASLSSWVLGSLLLLGLLL
ncbi:ly6/PLAUR domain-containing protein 8-like [Marmota flaviventris]|uniref:ly6/PLAUR domain-containing protein 8-like n=1 Tax=Marmota flaviventris TaxID=93162 RepID=UPI003A8A90FB